MKYYQRAVVSMIIDHHASNEGYGTINDIRVSESCAYNVFEILDKEMLKKAASAPHPNGADYLYMGILHDTSRFSRSDAGIEAAGSKLLAMGADHRYVMRTMQDKTLDDLIRQGEILHLARADFADNLCHHAAQPAERCVFLHSDNDFRILCCFDDSFFIQRLDAVHIQYRG